MWNYNYSDYDNDWLEHAWLGKGAQASNHKYISRDWIGGKWVYKYADDAKNAFNSAKTAGGRLLNQASTYKKQAARSVRKGMRIANRLRSSIGTGAKATSATLKTRHAIDNIRGRNSDFEDVKSAVRAGVNVGKARYKVGTAIDNQARRSSNPNGDPRLQRSQTGEVSINKKGIRKAVRTAQRIQNQHPTSGLREDSGYNSRSEAQKRANMERDFRTAQRIQNQHPTSGLREDSGYNPANDRARVNEFKKGVKRTARRVVKSGKRKEYGYR